MVNRVLRDFSFGNHSKYRTSANVCFKYDRNYKTTQSISDLLWQMKTVNADVWREREGGEIEREREKEES